MSVITISRQYGSGGDEVAIQICEKMCYRYFDKTMMDELATAASKGDIQLADLSEDTYEVRGALMRMFGSQQAAGPCAELHTWVEEVSGERTMKITKMTEDETVHLVRSTLNTVYKLGNTVILGRAGQVVLKDRPGVFHVRIEAPFEYRVGRVVEKEKLTPQEAKEKIALKDRAAHDYLKRFYDVDWADTSLYHLVINTGLIHETLAGYIIMDAISRFYPEESPKI
jgi:cytidylate kinase